MGYLGFHMTANPQSILEKRKKAFYQISFLVLSFLIIGLTLAQSRNEDKENKEKTALFGTMSKQLNDLQIGRSNDNLEIISLRKTIISNSAPSVGIAILADDQEKLSQKQIKLLQEEKTISELPVDLQSLRAERINKQELQEVAKQHDELQKEREEIEAQIAQSQAERQRRNDEERRHQEALENEHHTSGQSIGVFNYAINKLRSLITSIASDTGNKVEFDFPDLPTVYDPIKIVDARMLMRTNFIRLGTNSAWEFKIIVAPRGIVTNRYKFGILQYSEEFEKLTIMTLSNSILSSLTIAPLVPNTSSAVDAPPSFNTFSIRLSINPIHRSSTEKFRLINFGPGVDEALRTLLESRDAEFPLTIRRNAP